MQKYIILLFLAFASLANAQTVTTWKGNVIPVRAIAGADITISPIDPQFATQHVGWVQVGITVHPVYQGDKGGLFTYRANKQGIKVKYYLTEAQKAKMYKE